MKSIFKLFIMVVVLWLWTFHSSCQSKSEELKTTEAIGNESKEKVPINEKSIVDRFPTPEGFERVALESNSFGNYLRSLPLKPKNSPVLYYNGQQKLNANVYSAVIDLPIGKRDLHQCADAIMRLRAEYLWENKQYDKIHFNFTNGFQVDYLEWSKGRRIIIDGNKTYWDDGSSVASTDYNSFWDYLELIFSYAGTASLEKEMKPIEISAMQIGDVLIQGGYPGHAVIVVDMCENKKTGQKKYLLAQSYMPAQELQILKNPKYRDGNSWYDLENDVIQTPEWIFSGDDGRRF